MRNLSAVFFVLLLSTLGASIEVTSAAAQAGGKPLGRYNFIAVGKFTVDKNPATEDFPKGLETLMQSKTVKELREKKVFEEVVDDSDAPASPAPATPDAQKPATEPGAGAKEASTAPGRRLTLNATVVTFDKGSRAARYWVGFGAGQAKMKVRFVFQDAQTGAEVLRFDHEGTFKGIVSVFGGSQDEAFAKAASSVVNGLLKEIAKNR